MKPVTGAQRRLLGELARPGVTAVGVPYSGPSIRNADGDWLGSAFRPSLDALTTAGYLAFGWDRSDPKRPTEVWTITTSGRALLGG